MPTKFRVCSRTRSEQTCNYAGALLALLSLSLASCAFDSGSRVHALRDEREAPLAGAIGSPRDDATLNSARGNDPGRVHQKRAASRSLGPLPSSSIEEHLAFERLAQLDRISLIREVLTRNPSVEAARQAWRAALAEHPQATALPDPALEYSTAPLTIRSDDVTYGQIVGLSQRFPWPGKLALKGKVATAEAEAARHDYEATRQSLALIASILFDQYRAVVRSLELNEEHRGLALDIKAAAEAQYEAGRASQQAPLQAEVEHSHVLHRGVVLRSRRAVIIAQLNGLLHRSPEQPLPPPAPWIEPPELVLEASEALQEQALQNSPELLSSEARVRARESAVDLAKREYYPDFAVKGSYNSLWAARDNRWMVGLSLNIPIQFGARNAATSQAKARLASARARLAASDDAIRVEAERARQHLIEARDVVRLYDERLLPAVRAQIEAALIGYETGRNGFQALIDAERSLRTLETEHQDAIATFGQRHAELERALGGIPGLPRQEGGIR